MGNLEKRKAGFDAVELTPREQQVLELLTRGRANKDIAKVLDCSVRTVEFHISNLLRKLGACSRLELVTHEQQGAAWRAASKHDAPSIEVRLFAGTAATVLGDTLLILWTAPATLERWNWHASLIEQLALAHAEGVQCLSLVLSGSLAPDRFVRARIQADLGRFGRGLRRFVGVALGDSLWGSAVHSIMRAAFFVSGQAERLAVTRSLEQGFDYILESAGPSTPARSELRSAVAELARLLGVGDSDGIDLSFRLRA